MKRPDLPIVDVCLELLLVERGQLGFHPNLADVLDEARRLAYARDARLWTRATARLRALATTLSERPDGARAAAQLRTALAEQGHEHAAPLFSSGACAPAHDAPAPADSLKAHRWQQPGDADRRRVLAGDRSHRTPRFARS